MYHSKRPRNDGPGVFILICFKWWWNDSMQNRIVETFVTGCWLTYSQYHSLSSRISTSSQGQNISRNVDISKCVYFEKLLIFRNVDILKNCGHSEMWTFWNVDILKCGHSELLTFWNVDILKIMDIMKCWNFENCGHSEKLLTFRNADIFKNCGHFEMWTFWIVDIFKCWHSENRWHFENCGHSQMLTLWKIVDILTLI